MGGPGGCGAGVGGPGGWGAGVGGPGGCGAGARMSTARARGSLSEVRSRPHRSSKDRLCR